jgi:RES domain-containing protein
MEVFRLQRARHGPDLSGAGAARKGARWNSAGIEIIYTSASRALAMSEIAVHFTFATLPADFMLFQIFIPDDTSIKVIQPSKLPVHWNSNPPSLACQAIGDDFIRAKKYCLLKIPSAVVRGDFNILINPAHPEFAGVRVLVRTPFPFDNRLFEK